MQVFAFIAVYIFKARYSVGYNVSISQQGPACHDNHFTHGQATYMTGLLVGSLFGGALSDKCVFATILQESVAKTQSTCILSFHSGMERSFSSYAAQLSTQLLRWSLRFCHMRLFI